MNLTDRFLLRWNSTTQLPHLSQLSALSALSALSELSLNNIFQKPARTPVPKRLALASAENNNRAVSEKTESPLD
jgi:hypothetical protein